MKYLKISLVLLLLVTFISLPAWYVTQMKEFNTNRNCEDPAAGLYAVFILDVSDPFDLVDLERAREEIVDIVSTFPKGSTYQLLQPNQTDFYFPSRGLRACVVPQPDDMTKLLLSKNMQTDLDLTRRQAFEALRQSATHLLATGETKFSPLLETLIAVSKLHDFRKAGRRRIYIYSDMEQNTPAVTIYDTTWKPDTMPLEVVSLRGAAVHIKRIVRRNGRDFAAIKPLWDAWFKKAGATVRWEK